MAVGWRCNVGYATGTPDTVSITNISQFTFLDKGVPFVIPVIKQFPPDSVLTTTYYGFGSDDLSEMYNLIDTYYGPDWYITYGALFSQGFQHHISDEVALSLFEPFVPGWDKAWPQTTEYYKSLDRATWLNHLFVIYIPNLKRALFYGPLRDDNNLLSAMKVNDDGTFSRLAATSYAALFSMSPSDLGLERYSCYLSELPVLIVPYTSYDVLKNPANFRTISINYESKENDPEYVYIIERWDDTELSEMVASLFTDGTAPDFEGTDIPPENPYEPGGDSGPGVEPPGTFDDTSDPIPDSPLPTLSAANTGFTRIYNPTLAQVQDLARYLWTDETVIQTIWNHVKQFFENPMEAIIGFNLVPVPVPDDGAKNFALMYIDTGVSMNVAANQFVDLDCGTVKLNRYYGSAMDQSPYTKVSCFLPYIGMVSLNTDEVMGTTLQVLYRIDIVSGSCVAKILVDGNVLYQYSGHCAINIPISSADFSSYVSAAISVAKLAVGAIAGGVGGALAAAGSDASQATNNVVTHTTTETTTARNPSTGRQITSGTRTTLETFEWPVESDSTRASYAGLTAENVTNTAAQVITSKPHVMHSGSFSGNTGYLGVRRPYLIIERPNMCLPKDYQTFNGFPAMITMTLNECSGFTKIQQVQLTGMTATNPEQAEIMMLLKSGVIF